MITNEKCRNIILSATPRNTPSINTPMCNKVQFCQFDPLTSCNFTNASFLLVLAPLEGGTLDFFGWGKGVGLWNPYCIWDHVQLHSDWTPKIPVWVYVSSWKGSLSVLIYILSDTSIWSIFRSAILSFKKLDILFIHKVQYNVIKSWRNKRKFK